MAVYWLEQTEQDMAVEDDWLSPEEVARLRNMRFAKRRADWRLGRWTAKRALACCLGLAPDPRTLAAIEMHPTSSGAPAVFIARRKQTLHISLSHCCDRALCAITLSNAPVGCDLEVAEVRSDAFVTDYFTATEQAYVRNVPPPERWQVLALLWTAKECALKALEVGLRLDTRLAVVSLSDTEVSDSCWRPLQVSCPKENIFVGFHSRTDKYIRTIVSSPPSQLLIQLKPSAYHLRATRSGALEQIEEVHLVR